MNILGVYEIELMLLIQRQTIPFHMLYNIFLLILWLDLAQSAGALEYTDWTFAKG